MTATAARVLGLTLGLCGAAAIAGAAEKPQKAFAKSWQGARVVVKQTLYTLVYDELTRRGGSRTEKLEGLTIITPSAGTYYEFAGRQGQDDVTHRDPNGLFDAMTATYRRALYLDIGNVKPIEPKHLVRSEAGVELIVSEVEVRGDRVRLELRKPPPDRFATTLTVKWPITLSEAFTERQLIEDLLGKVIEPRRP